VTTTRAVIHLGPVKTGTTALSQYLTALVRAGEMPPHIAYPVDDLWFGESGDIVRQRRRLEILMEPHVHDFSNLPDAMRPDSEMNSTLAEIARVARKSTAPVVNVIFIAETGLPRFNPRIIDPYFRAHFDEVKYVFMARRQDKLVTSIVAQHMKMWERRWTTLSPRIELAKAFRLKDFAALDYAKQYLRWTEAVGAENVIAIPYLEGEQGSFGAIDRFFEFVGLGSAPRVDGIEGRRIHPTFSAAGMNRLNYIKRVARWTWWFTPFRKRLNAAWAGSMRNFHERAIDGAPDPDGTPFSPWSLSETDQRWVMRRFRESNRALRAHQTSHTEVWDIWLSRVEEITQ
jgi:hypothetical protein